MKIAKTLTIVSSAMFLAAGCSTNQERQSRNNETSFSAYQGSSVSETAPSDTVNSDSDQSKKPLYTSAQSPSASGRTGESSRIYSESTSSTAPSTTSSEVQPSQGVVSAPVQAPAPSEPQALSPTSDQANSTSRIYSKDQTDSGTPNATQGTTDNLNSKVQGVTEADRTLGQQIVQQAQADTTVAALIPMIKIKVDNGTVTLRGKVKSEQEKQQVEAAVQKINGVSKVDNQLKINTDSQDNSSNSSDAGKDVPAK